MHQASFDVVRRVVPETRHYFPVDVTSFLLLADGVSFLLLSDGVSKLILEESL